MVPPVRAIRAVVADIGLAAEDRLYAVGLGLFVEVDGAEHVAVVGERDGVHAQAGQLGEQILQADGSVEQAVLAVNMEVSELARLGAHAGRA